MLATLSLVIATSVVNVPDNGLTALMLGGSVLSLGLIARFVKNRKK